MLRYRWTTWNEAANTRTHTHTRIHILYTCLQFPFHGLTKFLHFWIALNSNDHITDCLQGIISAFLLQTQVKLLISQCWIVSQWDLFLVSSINNPLFQQFHDDSVCIHLCNEPVPKVVKNQFSCMEREESDTPTAHVLDHHHHHPRWVGSLNVCVSTHAGLKGPLIHSHCHH